MPVYKISIEQVQRLSYVDQLTLLCIFNSFNMKNNFYIDSMDSLHFEQKTKQNKKHVMDLLHFGKKIISFYKKSLKIIIWIRMFNVIIT